jgi:CRP-like cAMP-binding protein
MFFNEDCLAVLLFHSAPATSLVRSLILSTEKNEMTRLLNYDSEIATLFLAHMLSANARLREELVDVLCSTASLRLAHVLLLLADRGIRGAAGGSSIPTISQGVLAAMVGTTRRNINVFLKRFMKLGYISCYESIEVRSSLRRAPTNNGRELVLMSTSLKLGR